MRLITCHGPPTKSCVCKSKSAANTAPSTDKSAARSNHSPKGDAVIDPKKFLHSLLKLDNASQQPDLPPPAADALPGAPASTVDTACTNIARLPKANQVHVESEDPLNTHYHNMWTKAPQRRSCSGLARLGKLNTLLDVARQLCLDGLHARLLSL